MNNESYSHGQPNGGRKFPAPLAPFVAPEGDYEYPFFVDDLKKSGLTPDDVPDWYAVRGQGIGRFTRLTSSQGGVAPSPGYAIPYHSLSGEPIQDMGEAFIRFRLQVPLTETKREDGTWKTGGKYLSPMDTGSHLYVPRATADSKRLPNPSFQ